MGAYTTTGGVSAEDHGRCERVEDHKVTRFLSASIQVAIVRGGAAEALSVCNDFGGALGDHFLNIFETTLNP